MEKNTVLKTAALIAECHAECPAGMTPIIQVLDMFGKEMKHPKFIMYTRGSVSLEPKTTGYSDSELRASLRSFPNLPSSLQR